MIKSCGRKRPLRDYELQNEHMIEIWERFEKADQPIMKVEPKRRNRSPSYDFDDLDGIEMVEEKELSLASIWTPDERNNVSEGECSNAQVGIIYTYDFGGEWNVHITCEEGNIFYTTDVEGNLPIFKEAQGAPPIEHASGHVPGELEGNEKTVSPHLFDPSYFQAYCKGTVTSCARKTELEIITSAEAEERCKERERKAREARAKRDQEGDGVEEGDEEDEDEDEDEGY
ncbi:hypothetical protein HYDPIDRAFT_118484 [Hydnomerulius pinastri MD-312]|uniref:Uncharacterized protein n=1 Tax=Hydnomerulius pinastri MD-312 TaxID=994086 RepID=A0A0C9W0U7_9AGAM|nr:hypothetical protein HYDPIDRAFT_118484 [Hydnomerulius pinastri MD-312]